MTTPISIGWPDLIGNSRFIFLRYNPTNLRPVSLT